MKVCFVLSLAAPACAHIIRKEFAAGAHVVIAGHDAHTMAVSGTGHAEVAASQGRIVPPVEDVAGDREFYGPPFPADYPHDAHPQASIPFKGKHAAYPKLQDHETFHDDFVKDDDSDGGKWSAQMAYDKARTKVAKENQEAKDAEQRVLDAKSDVEATAKKVAASRDQEKKLAEEAQRAWEAAAEAKRQAAEKQKEVSAEAAQSKKQSRSSAEEQQKEMKKKVQDAQDALKKQEDAYKNCVKELEEARARVKELESKKPDLVSQNKSNPSAEDVKALEEAKAKTAQAEAKRNEAVEELVEARMSKEQAEARLEHEQEESAKAQQQKAKETQEVKDAEQELREAKAKLRYARGYDAVPGNAQPAPEQAIGRRASASAVLSLGVALATLLMG